MTAKFSVLSIDTLTLLAGRGEKQCALLREVTARFPENHLAAIIGPSGSGKSTFIKTIAGIYEASSGAICWQGRDLAVEGDLEPTEIGYVPQFSIVYDDLTVWENVETAMRLRVGGLDDAKIETETELLLLAVGLDDIAERRVKVLSGGQKRRLALALELVTSPHLLLCDEVTSGLDAKSEHDVMQVLRKVASKQKRVVLAVTHSLRHLSQFDSVLVLHEGRVAYHGAPAHLLHYFNVKSAEDVFPRLALKSPDGWHESWQKHRAAYYEDMALAEPADSPASDTLPAADPFALVMPPVTALDMPLYGGKPRPSDVDRMVLPDTGASGQQSGDDLSASTVRRDAAAEQVIAKTPGIFSQAIVLLGRRWRVFLRNRAQIGIHLAMILGFPCMVAVFAMNGLPAVTNQMMELGTNPLEQVQDAARFTKSAISTGSLVSGLVMLQVVLLTLMGANNGAREIASERLLYEKERLGGIRPASYLLSKVVFLVMLVVVQSVWMAWFVKAICHVPGDFASQIVLLLLANASLTSVSLGISSVMRTAEQASLASIYLVGFQLPLSGAVLALPDAVASITQPFIAAFWAWSGILSSMSDSRYYDVVLLVTQTTLSPVGLAMFLLACHVAGGLLLTYFGLKQSRWS